MLGVERELHRLDPERRRVLSAVRKAVNEHLPQGYAEGLAYGMIAWYVPLATFPDTYNGQPLCYIGLAAQKNHMALYLMGLYSEGPELGEMLPQENVPAGVCTRSRRSTFACTV